MFKDKFQSELNNIKPSNKTKLDILSKIEQAEQKINTAKEPKQKTPMRFIPATAVFLAAVIIGVSVWGINPNKPNVKNPNTNTNISGSATIPNAVTYDAVYKLFDDIYQTTKPSKPLFQFNGGLKGDSATGVVDDVLLEYATDISDTEAGTNTNNMQSNQQASGSKEEYSTTNNQVAEVEEADVIKTDGKYIYSLNRNNGYVAITKADKGKLKQISTIKNNNTGEDKKADFIDMYVSNQRVIIIMVLHSNENGLYQAKTKAEVFDVSNPVSPVFVDSFAQSGYHISTRLYNGVLYMMSNQTFYQKPQKNDVSTYTPTLYIDDKKCPVEEENLCIFDGEVDRQYLTISSLDIKNAKKIDTKAVVGGGETIYASTTSIYAAAADCSVSYEKNSRIIEKYTDTTRLVRFDINKGKITAAAEGSVRGTLLNQFSMDEHGDYFRVVTTVSGEINEDDVKDSSSVTDKTKSDNDATASSSDQIVQNSIAFTPQPTTNALFVLDKSLKIKGRLINLAPDEKVYSVRFMGDYGYFVTFRQVDPLFAVNLKDPENPKILSALKIPGFSNYMHPFADGLLLGIGKNADEKTGRVGTVKLSMFDINDPTDVKEIDKTSLDCYYTQVDNTHKAALVDGNKNLIAFMGSDYFYVYSYKKGVGFEQRAKIMPTYIEGYYVRGLYIGDYFYICTYSGIYSYDIKDFKSVDSIIFTY